MNLPERKNLRLQKFDYSQDGAYFITIIKNGRRCLFGKTFSGEMNLTQAGQIVKQVWLNIPEHFHNVKLGEFISMPNHIHGIIHFTSFREIAKPGADVGARHVVPTIYSIVISNS